MKINGTPPPDLDPAFVTWLEAELDRVRAEALADPGFPIKPRWPRHDVASGCNAFTFSDGRTLVVLPVVCAANNPLAELDGLYRAGGSVDNGKLKVSIWAVRKQVDELLNAQSGPETAASEVMIVAPTWVTDDADPFVQIVIVAYVAVQPEQRP